MTDDTDASRRKFLAVAGGVALAGLAGCSSGTDDGGAATDTTDDSMDTTTDDSMGTTTDDSMGTTTDDSMGTTTDDSMGTTTDDSMGTTTDDSMGEDTPTDPAMAPRVTVDRFSEAAGTLMVRTDENGLPGPGEPVDFDQGPFITKGLGPAGEEVQYYNFDVQSTEPAPIYAFVREDGTPVADQLNVVGTVPGDEGYNDFWQVNRVTVPDDYVANTVTSVAGVMDADYDVEATDVVKNCPVVPEGSTASKRYGDGSADLVDGWYDGQVVSYFLFEEASLRLRSGKVPLSPIYVAFNTNPGEDGGGPASGFVTEMDGDRTHNVVASLPDTGGYSPLWVVNVYDNADFGSVSDLASATDATQLVAGAARVNCPIVSVQ